jgi:adenine-specific DNA-methyltransferase
MNGQSLNILNDNLEKLKQIFPELFTENKVDWEKLKAAFGDDINFLNERYVLNWAGKADAFKTLQIPTTATLKPVPEESINFETTENVFIEGENLEVLKVLQKSYYGKVKCIIIDPPYNTGSDSFIYPDKFSEKKEEYLKRVGDIDEEGLLMKEGLFRKNSKESGHYHSNWLSMMFPRLFLAKNLLREDGVIFVHIDDNEVHNLRLVMNEIFGEENFVAEFVWEGAIKNDSKFVSISHDYIICFSKNKMHLTVNEMLWRTRKEGIDFIYAKVEELKRKHKDDFETITEKLREWYSSLSKNNPAWSHKHYNKVDKRGVYFPGDISWPGGGGPRYEVLHQVTKKPVRVPTSGWRYAKPESMQNAIDDDRIDFGENENKVPTLKRYLHEIEGQVLPSVIYKDRRAAMQRLRLLLGSDVFENPKDENILSKLIEATTKNNDIILDFFAGSATTAHTVFDINKEYYENRKFILAQLPEPCEESSEAYKAGYKTIAEIAKERIRRVIKKLAIENEQLTMKQKNELPFEKIEIEIEKQKTKLDLGFKVFKLSPSNFKIWRSAEITEDNLESQLDAFVTPAKPNAQKQNVLYELMIKAGYELTDKIEEKGNYFSVKDNELIVVLDAMNKKLIESIIALKPQKVITLDSLFAGNDQLKTNTVLQMRDAQIDFKTI